ncbi:MAG: HD domain-containing phosphohydrolase [Paenibacillaceae bacterium]
MHEEHDIVKIKLKEELSPKEMLKIIFNYTALIANERVLESVLILMADMGREMVLSDRCTVWLIDEQKNEIFTTVAHGVPGIRQPLNTGFVGHAIQSGETIIVEDAYEDPRFNPSNDQRTGYRTKSIISVPFRNNEGKIIGAYQAVNKMTASEMFTVKDLEYLTLAASYSGKSLESVMLTNEIEETQKEIIMTMGEIGESRSKETGNHVKRVAEYSYIIALALGMSLEEAELLKLASPMHDIGKVAIPDAVLKKPGKLTDEEFDIMKSHTDIGYNLLRNSSRRILKTAAIVAYEHHEKWNGRGYPQGLKEKEIHIYGRITALADVFDALGSDRVYKQAWELDRILNLFKEESGQHFDPHVVEAFMKKLPAIIKIRDQYSDAILNAKTE